MHDPCSNLEYQKKKNVKGHYWDNCRNLNMDCILESSIMSILNVLSAIIALWLQKKISSFLKDTC